jgi:flagellar motor switch protein FliM
MTPPDDETDMQQAGDSASLADEWGAALAEQGSIKEGEQGDVAAEWANMIHNEANSDGSEPGADRLLSQDEIDSLIGFMHADNGIGASSGVRAIADTGQVSHERLPMLEIIFDRMVRLLSTSLRNFFSDNVEVTLEGITSVRFGDYLNSIPLPALLAVVRAEGWDNLALVTVESSLTYSALDMLLGGRRSAVSAKVDGRAFTSIETQLVRRLVEVTLGDAEVAFQPLSPVKFVVDRIETNPRFAAITRPANAAILIDLRVDMEGRGGNLQILLPYATIEPIRDLLLQSFMGEKLGRDPVWEGHFSTEIWQASVAVEAVLHETRLPLKSVLSLQVGDTLMFDARPDALVTLRCGETDITEGRIGRVENNVAIQIARPLRRSRLTLAAFEASASGRKET